jgi:hypothetical protein
MRLIPVTAFAILLLGGCGARSEPVVPPDPVPPALPTPPAPVDTPTPVEIPAEESVVELASDGSTVCGRTSLGGVFCWGMVRLDGFSRPHVMATRQPVSGARSIDVDSEDWCALTPEGASCGFILGVGVVRLPTGELPVAVSARGLLVGEHSVVRFGDEGCLPGRGCPESRFDTDPGPFHDQSFVSVTPPPSRRLTPARCELGEGPHIHFGYGFLDEGGRLHCREFPTFSTFVERDVGLASVHSTYPAACGVYLDGRARCATFVSDPYDLAAGATPEEEVVPVSDVVELGPIGSDRPRTVRLTPWSGERLFSACARRRDGTVWCWGSNQCDLEDATVTGTPAVPNECEWQFTSAPWQIELPTQASSIVVGRSHACALLEDDSVWCWGSNVHGQLGDGTQVDSVVPVRVVGLPRTL